MSNTELFSLLRELIRLEVAIALRPKQATRHEKRIAEIQQILAKLEDPCS